MRIVLLLGLLGLVTACQDETAAIVEPAPPADANVTATIDGQSVLGGTSDWGCAIDQNNTAGQAQFNLYFEADGHLIGVGIAVGDAKPGKRELLSGQANAHGIEYGPGHDGSGELTALIEIHNGYSVSGSFDLTLPPASGSGAPLEIRDARFEQVECIDTQKAIREGMQGAGQN